MQRLGQEQRHIAYHTPMLFTGSSQTETEMASTRYSENTRSTKRATVRAPVQGTDAWHALSGSGIHMTAITNHETLISGPAPEPALRHLALTSQTAMRTRDAQLADPIAAKRLPVLGAVPIALHARPSESWRAVPESRADRLIAKVRAEALQIRAMQQRNNKLQALQATKSPAPEDPPLHERK